MGEQGMGIKAGAAAFAAIAGIAWMTACHNDFDSPYMPGTPDYAGDDWTRDSNGNGIADSVEKYAPGCKLSPQACLADAKVISRISGQTNFLAAHDMLLWLGDSAKSPSLEWTPAEGSVRGYQLTSSDSSKVKPVAGALLPVGLGSAQINVTVPGADSLSATFIAKVVTGGTKVQSVSAKDMTLQAGADTLPVLTWTPADATFKDYTLTSDKPDVARAQGQGILAVFAGKANIVLETQDGGHKCAFSVTVVDGPPAVLTYSIAAEDMFLVAGAAAQAPVVHRVPDNVADTRYTLWTSDTSIASVSADKTRIIPKAVGTVQANILAQDGSSKSAEFTVTVSADSVPVKGIIAADLNLIQGADPSLPSLTWQPSDATNRKYALTSSDSAIAAPKGNMIAPLSLGSARFIIRTADGGYLDTFTVNVGRPDSTIHVDSVKVANLAMTAGETRKLNITWFPTDAGNRGFAVSSSDSSVAYASGDNVKALKEGVADFHLVTADGGRTADFKVTVHAAVVLVRAVSADSMTLVVDAEQSPTLTWTPADATNQTYSLVSSDTTIASIAGTRVHAKAIGSTQVTVTSVDGPSAVFTVAVYAKAIPVISISAAPFTMNLGDAARDPVVAFNPSNASNKGFTVSAPAGQTVVSLNGTKVSPLNPGKVGLVIASAESPKITAVCSVTVVSLVRAISAVDDTIRLGAPDVDATSLLTWDPANPTDKSFVLKSQDTTLVKVNGKLLHAVAGGKASVVVKALDGSNKADTFSVTVAVPLVSISAKDYTMKTTDTAAFNPFPLFTYTPSDAFNKNWYLNVPAGAAPNVVKLVGTWQFAAAGPGATSLIVISADNPAIKDTFNVTVVQPVTGITAANLNMAVGDPDKDPSVTVMPANATNKGFTISGGTTGVAGVVGAKIHAIGPGTANFLARSNYDTSKTAAFTVTVTVGVASISVADLSMKVGETKDPVITWNPSNATNKNYSMTSLNTGIVSVVANRLQGAGPGTVNVVVTAADGGKFDTMAVTVIQPVVSISVADMNLKKGDPAADPVVTWNPANASDKNFTLSGGGAAVATVANGHQVKAQGPGTTTFTATSEDGAKTATFNVTVTVPVTGIQGNNVSMNTLSADVTPTITVSPMDATNKGWKLTSGDESIVTIVNDTQIHAVNRGNAQVTVTSLDNPSITDTFTVQVRF